MPTDDILWMTATDLVAAYRSRALSPVEVVQRALARIDAVDGILNSTYAVDAKAALEAAKVSEDRWRRGAPIGLLDGVPTTAKDALATKGMPMYRGSAATATGGQIADHDIPSIARMREHGAIILGKTTMCDFGILAAGVSSHHGVTRNPWDTRRNTGGSSSGAAATVAAGINPVVVGTDIVGSIRLPASFCGIFGHKPSQGRVPYYFPNSPSLVAGPMTRSVADAALMMDVLTGADDRDFTALPREGFAYVSEVSKPLKRARLRVIEDLGLGLRPDPQVMTTIAAAADLLRASGHWVESFEPPFKDADIDCAETFYKIRCLSEFGAADDRVQRRAPVIERWTQDVRELRADAFYRVFNQVMQLRERAARLIDDVDFLILPSVPVPAYEAEKAAPAQEHLFAPWCNTFLFNLTEQPAASINAGYTEGGLPIGLQIVGRRFDDLGVLRLASTYEMLRPAQRSWPQDVQAPIA